MADNIAKTVRVIANASNKELETVNIVTAQSVNDSHLYPQWKQITAAALAALPIDQKNEFATVQDGTALFAQSAKGTMRTVYIPGYVGPS